MNNSIRKAPNSGIYLGIALLWIGVVLLIYKMGIITPELRGILISWPILLTYIGLIGLISRERISGLILTVIGLAFLLRRIANSYPEFIPEGFWSFHTYIWPIIIIIIGLLLILYFSKSTTQGDNLLGDTDDDIFIKSSFMGQYEENYNGRLFVGGQYRSALSSMTIDLRGAMVKNDTVQLDLSVFMGSIELYLPANCTIDNRTKCLFGTVEDKRRISNLSTLSEFKLVITGSIVLGGVDING